MEAVGGFALEDDILDAALGAEVAFFVGAAIFVDDKDIGLELVDGGDEVHDAMAAVDESILDIFDAFDHEESLLLGIDGFVVLVIEDGGIGADAHIEVAIGGSLFEEFDMAAMEEVVAA